VTEPEDAESKSQPPKIARLNDPVENVGLRRFYRIFFPENTVHVTFEAISAISLSNRLPNEKTLFGDEA
jgi:hypothetical protein